MLLVNGLQVIASTVPQSGGRYHQDASMNKPRCRKVSANTTLSPAVGCDRHLDRYFPIETFHIWWCVRGQIIQRECLYLLSFVLFSAVRYQLRSPAQLTSSAGRSNETA